MKFKESETYKNLQKAFQAEAMAHLKYQFYKSQLADVSKDIENHLDEIVHNEKEHGKIWFKQLHNGKLPSDIDNIIDAINGEMNEFEHMYPDFAKVAFDEGFDDIGKLFLSVAMIEEDHGKKFSDILELVKDKKLFKDVTKQDWICLNCGHVERNTKYAPTVCSVCKHPQKYFVRNI